MAGPLSLLDVLQRFAATMVHSYEMNDMLYELGESAVSILGAAGQACPSSPTTGRCGS